MLRTNRTGFTLVELLVVIAMKTSSRTFLNLGLLLSAVSLPAAGCSDQKGVLVIHGAVTVGGQTPESGRLRFVPIEGTRGPASVGHIVNGQYRIEGRGGVPVGKHRVEVTALVKTGRQVPETSPGGQAMQVDETVNLAAEEYAGAESPLAVEVVAGSDGGIDIEIPPRSE